MGKFCEITNRNELADFLGIPRSKLTHILYIQKVDSYYTSFEIPKKNGDKRYINAPTGDLKTIQNRIADALWDFQSNIWKEKGKVPNISHAFEKKKSIMTNAKIHINKRYLLNIDLESFFDSFHFGRVQGYFKNSKEFLLPYEVATVIAQLTCYNGRLPQGAPSSPIITNLICKILDTKLLQLAKIYRLDYTRYADDLTFSTNNRAFLEKQADFYRELKKEIENAGFHINEKKTRFQFRDSKQQVTGLIVNKKLNVEHSYYRTTKAMAHHLYTKGEFEIESLVGTIKQLEGRFAFIDQIERNNNKIDKTNPHSFYKLNGRERQYQKFLFYKYFFSNDKPVILTEGKTDVTYIKAALKNLYAEYPLLIKKNADEKFEFKISFLRKSKRLNYFLNYSIDGGDAMTNLYGFFDTKFGGKNNYPDYLSYFKKMSHSHPTNPVIFVFDNELADKGKPLSKFCGHIKLDETKKKKLAEELEIKLIDDGNLFLLTNQLLKGKSECEIEDLFDSKTLERIIDGKTFSRESDYDISKHYGKEIFSKHVEANYDTIDFSNFKVILDNLNTIIESYKK